MSSYEFHVEITRDEVIAWSGDAAEKEDDLVEQCRAALVRDELATDTIRVLNRWMSYWEPIRQANVRHKDALQQPDTFAVVGRLLWRVLFAPSPDEDDGVGEDNVVGELLKEELAESRDAPMRLVIRFGADADPRLMGLPWEFLYEGDSDSGCFLAAETRLLLTRLVPLDEDRPTVGYASGKLRVQIIAAMPNDGAVARGLADVGVLRESIRKVRGLDVPEAIHIWDGARVRKVLSKDRCHIVHVIGVCRGKPGSPKIFLGGPGDPWKDPKPLLDALTPPGVAPPELIILQLCDYEDGDATENFELLAPALIRRKIPAVLAMQYSGRAEESGVGADFYTRLRDGSRIGEAVQETRYQLYSDNGGSPWFGTPVLYLQGDGALVNTANRGSSLIAGSDAAAKSADGNDDPAIRKLLVQALRDSDLAPMAKGDLAMWLAGLELGKIGTALGHVAQRMNQRPEPAEAQMLQQMMKRLERLKGKGTDGSTRTA